ncbi:MAG TPA: hypothetical protein VGN15_14375, partial [Ktedonobacteraceae bacterium]|nr:hypothetical protein [Ktedonobacteraceae bacterium]
MLQLYLYALEFILAQSGMQTAAHTVKPTRSANQQHLKLLLPAWMLPAIKAATVRLSVCHPEEALPISIPGARTVQQPAAVISVQEITPSH